MNRQVSTQKLTAAALLIAIGIVIPMFSPVKLVLPPASFTLASHVAIFIGMMISPAVAISVAVGTTLGFFIGPFPLVITLRAASHIVFALLGSLYLRRKPEILRAKFGALIFSLIIALIHAAAEVAVVMAFYFGGTLTDAYYEAGFVRSVVFMVGYGTVIHSMVDFEIALLLAKVLRRQKGTAALFIQ